jgi:hypothetical protein
LTGTCEEVLGGLLQLPIPQGCVLHRVSRTEDIEGCVRFCWLISELIFEREMLPEQHKNGSLVSVDKQKGRLIFMVLIERISDFAPYGPHTRGTTFPEKISETCSKSVLNCPHIHGSKREAKIHAQKRK